MQKSESIQLLFMGVAFGNTGQVKTAHEQGADLNVILDNGATPLTEAIRGGMGHPKVVRLLLELGADPSLRDQNGWTPWLSCISRLHDRVVQEEQEAIRQHLQDFNASREGETHHALWRAVYENQLDEARRLIEAGADPNWKLFCVLGCAVSRGHVEMARLLLEKGADVEGQGDADDMTPLMWAAEDGHLEMVQLLLDQGADPQAKREYYPSALELAKRQKNKDVVKLLKPLSADPQPPKEKGKFAILRQKGTNGINCDVDNDGVIAKIKDWDKRYGISLSEVGHDRALVTFSQLPDDLEALAREIETFCPDVIDQGFGCMDDAVAMMEESGKPIPEDMAALIEGIDFSNEDFGIHILMRSLAHSKQVALWWD